MNSSKSSESMRGRHRTNVYSKETTGRCVLGSLASLFVSLGAVVLALSISEALTEVYTTSAGSTSITRGPARGDGIADGDGPVESRLSLSSFSILLLVWNNEAGLAANADCSDDLGTLVVVGLYDNAPLSLSLLVLPLLTLGVCVQGAGVVGLLAKLKSSDCSEKNPPLLRDLCCPSYSLPFPGSHISLSTQTVLANIALQSTI